MINSDTVHKMCDLASKKASSANTGMQPDMLPRILQGRRARFRPASIPGAARAIVCLSALLLLGACATTEPPKPENVQDRVQVLPSSEGAVRLDTNEPQVAQLWSSAEKARLAGKNQIALELVYEALEIAPANALLWSRAAEMQLDMLEAALAESYATKSNAFAAENQSLVYRNWLIIEHARDMRGDLLGVRSAHKKVQQYQYQ